MRARLKCGTGVEKRPPDCEHLFHRVDGTPNDVWRGDPGRPSHKQRGHNAALGRTEFVEGQFAEKIEEHGSSWTGSRRCPIFKARGSCCYSVQRPGKLRSPPSGEQFPGCHPPRRGDPSMLGVCGTHSRH